MSTLFSFCFAVMACLNTLKLEIKTLEKIFTKNHERFRILNASVDELTCRFVGKGGKLFDIHANITVSDYVCIFVVFFLRDTSKKFNMYSGRSALQYFQNHFYSANHCRRWISTKKDKIPM